MMAFAHSKSLQNPRVLAQQIPVISWSTIESSRCGHTIISVNRFWKQISPVWKKTRPERDHSSFPLFFIPSRTLITEHFPLKKTDCHHYPKRLNLAHR